MQRVELKSAHDVVHQLGGDVVENPRMKRGAIEICLCAESPCCGRWVEIPASIGVEFKYPWLRSSNVFNDIENPRMKRGGIEICIPALGIAVGRS
jgi:hypothetical protein